MPLQNNYLQGLPFIWGFLGRRSLSTYCLNLITGERSGISWESLIYVFTLEKPNHSDAMTKFKNIQQAYGCSTLNPSVEMMRQLVHNRNGCVISTTARSRKSQARIISSKRALTLYGHVYSNKVHAIKNKVPVRRLHCRSFRQQSICEIN